MNDLIKRKETLEKQIALNKFLMDQKHEQWRQSQHEADEIQINIEKIRGNTNKLQESLKAVNEEINNIPTIDRHIEKKNPLWKELVTCLAFLFLTSVTQAQQVTGRHESNEWILIKFIASVLILSSFIYLAYRLFVKQDSEQQESLPNY